MYTVPNSRIRSSGPGRMYRRMRDSRSSARKRSWGECNRPCGVELECESAEVTGRRSRRGAARTWSVGQRLRRSGHRAVIPVHAPQAGGACPGGTEEKIMSGEAAMLWGATKGLRLKVAGRGIKARK